MEQTVDYKYLNFVALTNFDLWDVKRYSNFSNLKFDNDIMLSEILTPYKKPVSKEEMTENKWQIISKINFGGELFLRDFEEINTYKGNLYLVPDNAIIYSKINVRHGCIYYNEKGNTSFGVSSEYPTFTFDENKVNGYFLKKVLRSSKFKKLLNTKTSGISKARVKQDEFLNIKIPLPSLAEQEVIIKAYQTKIQQAQNLKQEAQNLEKEIERCFFSELGIPIDYGLNTNKGLRFIEYKDLDRWDGKKVDILNAKYPIENIGKYILKIATGTTPPTNRKEYFNGNINFYTPAELGNSMYLNISKRRLTKLAISDNKARKFDKGTLLFVGIGSTVGKIGIVNNEVATSNQQITGFKVDNSILINEFVYYYFDICKNITTKEQTKATLPIINQEKIQNIPIPIPKISTQQEIVNNINILKSKIEVNLIQAETLKKQAEQEFEQAIFN